MRIITAQELKGIGAQMLQYVDTICRNNGLKYFLMFGTLIGAVRHGGYIPWDDDIDIAMFRDDYNKFIKLIENDPKYKYIGVENDPHYYFTYGRITDKRTILKNRPKRKIKDFGIFIDIFPIDNAPSDHIVAEWRKEFDLRKKRVWATIPTLYDDFSWTSFLKYIKREMVEFPTRITLGPWNFNHYRNQLVDWVTQFNEENTDKLIIAETYSLCIYPREWFSDTVDLQFEGVNAMVPVGYDSILRKTFGDYMQLPPVEQRVSGHEFTAYWK